MISGKSRGVSPALVARNSASYGRDAGRDGAGRVFQARLTRRYRVLLGAVCATQTARTPRLSCDSELKVEHRSKINPCCRWMLATQTRIVAWNMLCLFRVRRPLAILTCIIRTPRVMSGVHIRTVYTYHQTKNTQGWGWGCITHDPVSSNSLSYSVLPYPTCSSERIMKASSQLYPILSRREQRLA